MTTHNNALSKGVSVSYSGYELSADQLKKSGDCLCERSIKTILCRACGYMFPGRLRICCPVHPNTIHLMDISCCPVCKAIHLKEFKSSTQKK